MKRLCHPGNLVETKVITNKMLVALMYLASGQHRAQRNVFFLETLDI